MPWTAPKSLTNDEVYAVTAHILRLNGIIGDDDVIDARTLPQVKRPKRMDSFRCSRASMSGVILPAFRSMRLLLAHTANTFTASKDARNEP
jgi:hypothetical protein